MGTLTRHSVSGQATLLVTIVSCAAFLTASIVLHYLHHASLAEFIVSIISIIAASSLTRIASRGILVKLQKLDHELAAGIFGAIFGNIAELCFVCTAAARDESVIAKTAVIGSLVSSCLVAFGTCLLAGDSGEDTLKYPSQVAKTHAQLLVVILASVISPTAARIFAINDSSGLLDVSRGSAIVLLVVFACYIYFFSAPNHSSIATLVSASIEHSANFGVPAAMRDQMRKQREQADRCHPKYSIVGDSEIWNVSLLVAATTSLAFSALFMFESIHAPTHYMSESFVGLVLMPCVLASVEYMSDALQCRRKESIAWIAEGAFRSNIRVALFVFPIAVIQSWAMGNEMDMILDGFQVTILALSVIMVNHAMHHGSSQWLHGAMFIASFLLFALAAFYYPNEA